MITQMISKNRKVKKCTTSNTSSSHYKLLTASKYTNATFFLFTPFVICAKRDDTIDYLKFYWKLSGKFIKKIEQRINCLSLKTEYDCVYFIFLATSFRFILTVYG